ncbi:MAG TPA: sulfur carrier protein ThiS [Desulfobacteraceae bacterium]|nr:MAG: thiamine biosynthesis protein ThiS [Deltaproteobacteria bacterium]HDZ24016.1 sulfur carrier protein ThiS [Desulfobacteraceae bacterium]
MIEIDGRQIPWHEGMTVAALLEEIEDAHHYAVVRLNGRLISRPNFEKTPVPDSAEVILIPMVAGG